MPILFLFVTFDAWAADVTIAWDANSESDLAGYKLCYGTSSGNYSNDIDVGNTTQYTVQDLVEGTTYYIAAKAYDTSDNESAFSKELVYTVPTPNSAPNQPAIPTGPSSGYVQNSLSFDTSGSDPDGDLLTYRFNWGDGNTSAWGGAFGRTHSYGTEGTYCVKAQSKDTQDATSSWSACLDVTISIQQHTISTSVGSNGSISPGGAVKVNNGDNQSFTITPNQNYRVADVVVDGSSVGVLTSFTFNNVDRDHSISASFTMANQAPEANAGADKSVKVNSTVQLDGGNSSDPNGDPLSYKWSFVARPNGSQAALSNTAIQRPTFVADVAGVYALRLIVNDGTVDSAPDTVSISTENSAPTADAGADQSALVNETVHLDGSGSSDVDGDSLTFRWSFVSRPGGSSATLSNTTAMKPGFDIDVAGTYTVKLIVNDGTVDSAPDTVSISTENSAPVANAGPDQAARVNGTVQLDGSGSSDVDGNNLTYKWSFVARPNSSNAALSSIGAMKPTFDVDVAGTYRVKLIVNDGTVNSAEDTVTISTENSAPVADAGSNQAVLVNYIVQLDGSGSSDVDGDSLTFKWALISRPNGSGATLSETTGLKPTFDIDVAGNYTVQLIVNDGTVDSAPDTVTISTENSPPVANAGTNQAVLVNNTVQLNGSGSSDVDGDSLTFKWSFVSKPTSSIAALSNPNAVKPSFDVDVAGTYTVQLIVKDGTVNSAPDAVTISTENTAPVAKAGQDQAVLVGDTVQLNGGGSGDVDGDTLSYHWSFVSRPGSSHAVLSNTNAKRLTFTVDVAGTYTVQLIVNDGTVNSAPDAVSISTDNSAPVANAGADQTVTVNDTVLLDGSSSSDADGDTLTYKWSFVSRPSGSNTSLSDDKAVKPTFRIDAAGSYTLQLIVNDGTDNSAADSVTILTRNSAPHSDAGVDQAVYEGDTVTLNGLSSSDPDNNIESYGWKQTGGTTVALSNANKSQATFTAPHIAGGSETLTFRLTVRDTAGLQDVDSCLVQVEKVAAVDSDGDGVSDDLDAFPTDPSETLDTDGDGEGNNADTDDDNDGMPDTWELQNGLNPLHNDANEDPDGDDISNISEYNMGTKPNHYEGNYKPETPVVLAPEKSVTVGLTPLLKTGEYIDPNNNDVHSKSQWKIIRAFDDECVFDVTSDVALTSITVPKQILEAETEYIWQVRYIDNHDMPSNWSEAREFSTDSATDDSDGNGIPDDREVADNLDLDDDGTTDIVQSDMKCVSVENGEAQVCVSIRDAGNAVSILSLDADDPVDHPTAGSGKGKPNFIEFGLIDFKILMDAPGDETTVTIYLSKKAYKDGNCFKYDPVDDVWVDYSDYTHFSPNRKIIYLTLKDGGFGDADGIENGIIVDPLALGSESDPSGGSSESAVDEIMDSIIPDDLSCFISTVEDPFTDRKPLAAMFILMMVGISAVRLLFVLIDRFNDDVRRRYPSVD